MDIESIELSGMQTFDFERMKEIRERAKLTQATAAAMADMSVSRWSDIESGKRVNVTVETMGRIADVLGCTSADLLTAPDHSAKKRRSTK